MSRLNLLKDVNATNPVPSLVTDGYSLLRRLGQTGADAAIDEGFLRDSMGDVTIVVWNSAGTGAMSITIRLWGYDAVSGKWAPLGTGPGATKGTINAGAAIDTSATNVIAHRETISGLRHIDRIYAHVTAIALGTGGTFSAALVGREARP